MGKTTPPPTYVDVHMSALTSVNLNGFQRNNEQVSGAGAGAGVGGGVGSSTQSSSDANANANANDANMNKDKNKDKDKTNSKGNSKSDGINNDNDGAGIESKAEEGDGEGEAKVRHDQLSYSEFLEFIARLADMLYSNINNSNISRSNVNSSYKHVDNHAISGQAIRKNHLLSGNHSSLSLTLDRSIFKAAGLTSPEDLKLEQLPIMVQAKSSFEQAEKAFGIRLNDLNVDQDINAGNVGHGQGQDSPNCTNDRAHVAMSMATTAPLAFTLARNIVKLLHHMFPHMPPFPPTVLGYIEGVHRIDNNHMHHS
jgi:hypothetical protein